VLEFRILGPLEASLDGASVTVSGRLQRALLTLLLLRTNQVVSAERLIDEIWGEHPPRTASTSLQNTVSQLRKALGPDVLLTRATGYVLTIEPAQLDLGRFEQLVRDARGVETGERSRLLLDALALWRGPPLADSELEPFAVSEARRLEELRLAALEEWIDAELELERYADLVGRLEALVAEHPLRERLRGQLMLALYRCERQAEALQVYHDGRRMLVDELGIEPSRTLQQLYGQILRHERVLDPAAVAADEPDELEEVARVLLTGRLVPVLGAGVNLIGDGELSHGERARLPERGDLAAHLTDVFGCPPEHAGELARVAQYVAVTRGIGPLYDELHAIFDQDYDPGPVHTFLADLPPVLRDNGAPQQLIVTTNYDRALERAFDAAGEEFDVVSFISLGRDRGKFLHRTAEGDTRVIQLPNAYAEVPLERRPVILKIHGEVDRTPGRTAESFVVSEDDYIAYLAETGLGGALPVTVAARLRRSHFLFLGYGLLDWSLRVFLHRLWLSEPADYRSWAVQPGSGAVEREFWRRRGVELRTASLTDYLAALRERLLEANARARSR
jgi:DNA-binding SARP family transcriptional activator